jgi:hypothetical protein
MAQLQGAPAGSARRTKKVDDTTFTRALRFEVASEEGRSLLVSWSIALTMGALWLLLVYFLPAPANVIQLLTPEETGTIDVTFEPPPEEAGVVPTPAPTPAPEPVQKERGGGERTRDRQPGGGGNQASAMSSAFAGQAAGNQGGVVGDVSGILRGVEVASGGGGAPGGRGGKAVIGYGQGGAGSRTPGRGGFGSGVGTGVGSGIGGVGGGAGGGGVGRSSVRVAPPEVIRAENLGGPGRDVSELGSFVRSRQSQLQFCYQEHGLKVNPRLAGTVTAAVTMTGSGNVTGVNITSRTWSGAGASEAESCIRSRINSWRFPASEAGGGTYSFPFNFTR